MTFVRAAIALALVATFVAGLAAAQVSSPTNPSETTTASPQTTTGSELDSPTATAPPAPQAAPAKPAKSAQVRIRWKRSRALGVPTAGRLVNGVQVPAEGPYFFTWDPVLDRTPNRPWRRWGTDGVVRITLRVLRGFAAAHPRAPRVGIGDLSRPRGGNFGAQFGALGHRSHQNGLDVDVYYPRRDRRELGPMTVAQVDRRLAQDLVNRFVAAGASRVFVGPNVGLRGPRGIVVPLRYHDNHLHARFPSWRA